MSPILLFSPPPQIFHFAKGQPYIDDVGTFKERMEWVGNPRRKDGSIVIHNLDYTDNGTFTCDVKNPPDIVGKSSQVTLYVLEKGTGRTGSPLLPLTPCPDPRCPPPYALY